MKKHKKYIQHEEKDEAGKTIWGTRWPATIGRKYKLNDDGKIRASNGNILQ